MEKENHLINKFALGEISKDELYKKLGIIDISFFEKKYNEALVNKDSDLIEDLITLYFSQNSIRFKGKDHAILIGDILHRAFFCPDGLSGG